MSTDSVGRENNISVLIDNVRDIDLSLYLLLIASLFITYFHTYGLCFMTAESYYQCEFIHCQVVNSIIIWK